MKNTLYTQALSVFYTYDNAKLAGNMVISLFRKPVFEAAAEIAARKQAEAMIAGAVHVYVPCQIDSLTPRSFTDLLGGAREWTQTHMLRQEEPIDQAMIYGTYEDALNGRNAATKEPHNGFIVVDSGSMLVVDMTDRTGKSVLDQNFLEILHDNIQRQLGYSIRWPGAELPGSQAPVMVADGGVTGP